MALGSFAPWLAGAFATLVWSCAKAGVSAGVVSENAIKANKPNGFSMACFSVFIRATSIHASMKLLSAYSGTGSDAFR